MTTTVHHSIATLLVRDLIQAWNTELGIWNKPMDEATGIRQSHSSGVATVLLAGIRRLATAWMAHMRHRRDYHKLMQFDDRMLDDMGLDRSTLWSALQPPHQLSQPKHLSLPSAQSLRLHSIN